jgi:hypothetical protein
MFAIIVATAQAINAHGKTSIQERSPGRRGACCGSPGDPASVDREGGAAGLPGASREADQRMGIWSSLVEGPGWQRAARLTGNMLCAATLGPGAHP